MTERMFPDYTLSIKGFCCIKSAALKLNRINVLTGPQASGKSLIVKMVFFFLDTLIRIPDAAEDNIRPNQIGRWISDRFKIAFPPAAWGKGNFEIGCNIGDLGISISGKRSFRGNSPMQVTLSEDLLKIYSQLLADLKGKVEKDGDDIFSDRSYQIRNRYRSSISRLTRSSIFDSQMFIPAGRSLFTSIGKTIAAFDEAKLLDPVTRAFGRRYVSALQHLQREMIYPRDIYTPAFTPEDFIELLGGRARSEREGNFLLSSDGRKIPFNILSSGQQELIPLIVTLLQIYIPTRRRDSYSNLVGIEEPEAHLFPSAQSRIVELMTSLINEQRMKFCLILTTHSPYILAKFNNLIKAGLIGQDNKIAKKAAEILDRKYWIKNELISAYCIKNQELMSIKTDDGLIDADYIDSVSEEISGEFFRLLEVEHG